MSVDFDYYLALRAAAEECATSSASRRSLLPREVRELQQRNVDSANTEETEDRKQLIRLDQWLRPRWDRLICVARAVSY